jgi:hypothetical protein
MHIKDGPRLGSWSVVQCTFLKKDIHLQPNSFIMTTLLVDFFGVGHFS